MTKDLAVGHVLWAMGLAATLGCVGGAEPMALTGTGGKGGHSGGGLVGTGGSFPGCESSDGSFGSGGASGFFSSGLPLQLGPTVTPAAPPPAVSGGTLLVLRNGVTAVVADPDRDQIFVVDLKAAKVMATISLPSGEQPGRIVEDGAGRVHVALRGAGAVMAINPSTGTIIGRRAVCAAPRGLAYDAQSEQVHLACAGGELVSLPAAGGAATRTLKLDRDLRDVVVDGDRLLVSRFRSAQVLTVDTGGKVTHRLTPAPFRSPEARFGQLFSASVSWRMVEMPGGGAAMVHQRGLDETVESQPGGYGTSSPCDAIVHSAVTVIKDGQTPASTPALAGMVLPTDLAVSADGKRVAVIATGNATNAAVPGGEPGLPRVFVTDIDSVTDPTVGCRPDGTHGPCMPSTFGGTGGADFGTGGTGGAEFGTGGAVGSGGASGTGGAELLESRSSLIASSGGASGRSTGTAGAAGGAGSGGFTVPGTGASCGSTRPAEGAPKVLGEPVAVAFDGAGAVVVQTREPAALFLTGGAKIVLSTQSRADTGHAVFHGNAGGFMACASCHPEGTDDGRVWTFSCEGRRRTQSLGAPIAGTEPLHWGGDMKTFPQIMSNVFMGRMSGPKLAGEQIDATFTWIDRRPRVPVSSAPDNPVAVERGRVLFHDDPKLACATCHVGAKLTNNMNMDVGTGGALQVPSLIGVGSRAPFMHDGCAKTLADRFNPACGGGDKHGVTSGLTAAQIADLVAYLETL